ncbi:MAG: PRC-barrel domain-containing protein [Legionella longbeachae]|nr:PRC-barrel domain-containing protein [Legionella longbeachae]
MEHRGVVKSGEVISVKVKNRENENLGEIAELVIDKQSGKVSYLVLDFGGFLGFGNKFFAVPWSFFSYNNEEDCFILNIDKQRLKDAPGFDKDHWPNFSKPEITTSITGFYSGV